jgi:hypothetical protein
MLYGYIDFFTRLATKNFSTYSTHPCYEPALSEIREATNKGWVLGNERFRAEIESMLQRRTCPLPRGGDRHSKQVRQGRINRV